ncbi:MAG: hypothetical protein CMK09_02770 [Ponticaulis sp.]|nr:hypothetical protein [Ponticaulis sp.]
MTSSNSGDRHASADRWFMDEILPLEAELEHFLRRRWRSANDIPDLRQEILTRVYRYALETRPANPRAFLYRTARNLLIDKIRQQSVISMDLVMDFEALNVCSDEADPFDTTSARQELQMLQDALEQLPERTRHVLVLRRVHGLSQRETAKKLQISEPTVERHISRGTRQLADYFRRQGVVRTVRKEKLSEARRDDSA